MHIETPSSHRYPWFVRLVLALQRRKYGHPLAPSRVWGRSPWLFLGVSLLYRALDRRGSPLDPALRSLVAIRISQLNYCAFCVDLNSATGLARGIAPEQLQTLDRWPDSPHFTAREKAALAYADRVTSANPRIDENMIGGLRRWFDDAGIVELTALIAFQNLSSRFNAALDIPDQGFCAASVRPPARPG